MGVWSVWRDEGVREGMEKGEGGASEWVWSVWRGVGVMGGRGGRFLRTRGLM